MPIELSDDHDYYVEVAKALQLDATLARTACALLNSLTFAPRRAFYALAIERRNVEECASLGYGSVDQVTAQFKQAVIALTRGFDRLSGDVEGGGKS